MDWLEIAKDIGFEGFNNLNMASLYVMQDVRNMCSADRCKVFGRNWACPPGCGSVEDCRKRIMLYHNGIIVQTVASLTDDFDLEGIEYANKLHTRRFKVLARQTRIFHPECLPLSAGPCSRCVACTYPNKPCRYPDKKFSSMEAYGLLVSDVCLKSGLPYYRGPNTITFTSCVLFKNDNY